MATTEPELPQVPDNDDVAASPAEPSLLDRTEATLGKPDAKIEDLGEDGLALIKKVIAEMKARQSVATSMEEDSDGLSRGQEAKEIDPRLKSLVVDPINALPEGKKQGRTGEEVARAIPDVAAFLAEIAQMKEGTFFELNEAGQLVMKDNCAEAYGLGEDSRAAKKRQTRIIYRGENGTVQVMEGNEYFTADENGNLALSDAAKAIGASSILMKKGLPTLQRNEATGEHTGEYARMNDKGQLERQKLTWTEDESLDSSLARYADWRDGYGNVASNVGSSRAQDGFLGSRGVLRVNLNFES